MAAHGGRLRASAPSRAASAPAVPRIGRPTLPWPLAATSNNPPHARRRLASAADQRADGASIPTHTPQPTRKAPATAADDAANPSIGRRQLGLSVGAAAALGSASGLAAAAGPAHAVKTVVLRDGTTVSAAEHGMMLSVVALRGALPSTTAADFKAAVGRYCGFSIDQRGQLADIYKELSDTSGKNKRSAGLADVVSLGDGWLGPAVGRGLVQPLPPTAVRQRWFRALPPRLRDLVTRHPATGAADPAGLVYGAPYRWGATLIAYRRDRLLRRGGRRILDWSDLLQPSLQGRLAMTDSPRELVAAALRSLAPELAAAAAAGAEGAEGGAGRGGGGRGQEGGRGRGGALSVNWSAAELAAAGVSDTMLQERVAALVRQCRLFSSRDHVRALQAGDVWAVVGASQDLVPLAERSGNMELVAPLSGTQLWAELWAVPSGAQGGHRRQGPSPLLSAWIEFTTSPGRITGQPGLKTGAPIAALSLPPALEPPPSAASSPHAAPHAPATPSAVQQHSYDAAGIATLAAIHAHRRHLEEALQAAEARSPLAALAQRWRNVQEALPFLPGVGSDADEGAAAGPGGDAGSRTESGGAHGTHGTGAQSYAHVDLHHANGYLPPPVVLARSEFLLPLDADTAALYSRIICSTYGGAGPVL